jgi:ankyrin repeat protein
MVSTRDKLEWRVYDTAVHANRSGLHIIAMPYQWYLLLHHVLLPTVTKRRHNSSACITALLSPGARLLAAADGSNPLFAAVEGGNLEVLQLLLDAGCVLNPRDQE